MRQQYVRIRISDRETRYIPWNLLLPWQARFLCRDSEYFSGQCVSNTFRNWLTINTVTNSLTRTCSSYCHTWPESPDSSTWYSASWLKHNFKVVQTVLRIRIRVNTVRTDLTPLFFTGSGSGLIRTDFFSGSGLICTDLPPLFDRIRSDTDLVNRIRFRPSTNWL